MAWQEYIPKDIVELYEVQDFKHGATILAKEFPLEFEELCQALRSFRFTLDDIKVGGGNESNIPKIFSDILRPMNWMDKNLEAELNVFEIKDSKHRELKGTIYHGTHKVDYLKGRVAFDLEWNSKDQTFDRDLYAFRAFFDYDAISVGILVTRSNELVKTGMQLTLLDEGDENL
jgi:CRISPR-associated protein Csd2